MKRMAPPPRVQLALVPTPILRLDRLSRELGIELYLKRDDLTGLLESGGEVRKLEFLVGEALHQGADTLITYGSPQSDWCRAVSAVATRLGLRALLVAVGEPLGTCEANLFLDRLLGAEIRYLSVSEVGQMHSVLEQMAEEVRRGGRRPYLLPESGSNELGALGYLECAVEISGQIGHGAPRFDTIVIDAWTGASQAGLLMGKQFAGLPSEIVGVPIAGPADRVREHISRTIAMAIRRFGFAIDVPKRIHLLDGSQGGGDGGVQDEVLQVVARMARQEGVLLGPARTAQAFASLLTALRQDRRALGQRLCFIHTGGVFGAFGFHDRLTRMLEDRPEGG
jgi:D-cysteine desulfhydrase family pyridoxal phosphate-dependent enzyme